MKFVLLLLLTLNGQVHEFAMDHDLTREDCQAALAANPSAPLTCQAQ